MNPETGYKEWYFTSDEVALIYKVVFNQHARWLRIIHSTENSALSYSYLEDIEKTNEFFECMREDAEAGIDAKPSISRDEAALLIEAFNYECAQIVLNTFRQDPSLKEEALRSLRDEILAYAYEIYGNEIFRRAYCERP